MAPNRRVLEVDALDLGGDVKATGLELLDVQSREPVPAEDAADTWTQLLPALAAGEYLVLDFFSHLNRVREYCAAKNISFREDSARCLVILPLLPEQMTALFERFGRETFGARAGATARGADRPLEEDLSRRGLDAYQAAYARYTFCAVCELGKGWVTLLSDKLWKSEILRRLRKPAEEMEVQLPRIS